MKIIVPTKENNQVDAHFGHCSFYKIFEISSTNQIIFEERMDSPQGCGCKSNVSELFQAMGIELMLAGGIGDGAINKLNDHGVSVIRNCDGDVNDLVLQYLLGKVKDSGSNCSSHEHGHTCSH
ncbi:MAG: NifB/NifX family molybdenum-iron cluster-binding protein [Bacteroidales bacterium]|nr:NifB/NifX family molybdenum-iron cluster-binding protein [Bacteroidales bacterium]